MFYRVAAFLAFSSEDEANDFYHDCELAIYKAVTINPGTPQEEKGHITHHVCRHDEAQPDNCDLLDEDFTV